MKKSIWIVLPIIIIAIVLVAVFAGQRNTLSAQIAQLESDKADLSKQLTAASSDAAALKEAQDQAAALNDKLAEVTSKVSEAEDRAAAAESKVAAAESKVTAAESKAQEVAEQLTSVTTERDTLQTNAAAAAEQLTTGIRQAQTALEALVGPTEDELSQTKAQLASYVEAYDQATMELQQAQDALNTVLGERDELKISLENAAATISNMESLTEAAKVAKASVVVTDANGIVVKEYEDISEVLLSELQPGCSITIIVYNAAGEKIVEYDVPYIAAAEETPEEEAPVEEAPAEEGPAA
ncbi:MAG: hypothetical protein IK099_03410 [Clostridia bacterium]|nr:hypothetical protein [Clostridia bacterium]